MSRISSENNSIKTTEDLINVFGEFGNVTDAYFLASPVIKSTKSTAELSAIVKFASWTDAEKACNRVNQKCEDFCVTYARPRNNGEGIQSISPKRLFVGQVPQTVTEQEVRSYFERFGTITDVSVLQGKDMESAGCAFIEYDTWAACDTAIETLNGKVAFVSIVENPIPCKSLVVKYAKPKAISVQCRAGSNGGSDDVPMESPETYWPSQYVPIMLYDPHMHHTAGYFFAPTSMAYYQAPPAHIYASDGQYPQDVDSRKIFVGQLPQDIDENDLVHAFGQYGPIENASILRNNSGHSRGCGFVTFMMRENAMHAAVEMNGIPFLPSQKPMVVRFASRRQSTTSTES